MLSSIDIEELILETKEPKYKVGDLVCSKKTGFPGVARVVSAIPAALYANNTGIGAMKYEELFPGWMLEYMYSVFYDEPRRNLTMEEFLQSYPPYELEFFKEEKLQELYEARAPEMRLILYPEQDLELFQ